jgi:hypothetical protein
VYNNDFINVGDSHFDYDCYANPNPHDIWIYNNLFRIVQAIDAYPEFFRFYNSQNSIASFTNIKILNNTFVDQSGYYTVRFDSYNGNPTATGIEIKNNIFHNCGSGAAYPVIRIENSTAFTASSFSFDGNVYYGRVPAAISYCGTTTWAANWIAAHEPHSRTSAPVFVKYTANAQDNDYHLTAADTSARDRGVALAYFTDDRDGTARPQGSGWDIGAYEYAGTQVQTANVERRTKGTGIGLPSPLTAAQLRACLRAEPGAVLRDLGNQIIDQSSPVRPGIYLRQVSDGAVQKMIVLP